MKNKISSSSSGAASSIVPIILSVLCAVGLWLYVRSVESPVFNTTYNGVKVELRNENLMQSGLSVLSGKNYTVDITLSGKKSLLSQLSADDIDAYVDLSTVREAGEYALDIHVDLEQGITLSDISEKTALVYVDVSSQKTIQISQDITYYGGVTTEAGYSLGKPYIVPSASMPDVTVTTISGPVSVIGTVDHAEVRSIDIGAVTVGSSTGSIVHNDAVLQLFDADGNIIDNPHIKVTNTNLTVNFPINLETELPVEISFSKTEEIDDYTVSVSPEKVRVKGEKSVVNAMGKLTLSVEGAPSAGTRKYPLSAEGVEITDGTTSVTVTVKKKPEKESTEK